MGCDIHIAIQVLDGGFWQEIPWQDNHRWDNSPLEPGTAIAPEVFDNRNYSLFGILADVRNGTGFAGVVTGSGWPSIAPNRGLADDIDMLAPDPSYRDSGSRWLGEHSFTYVGLDELMAYPWDSTVATRYGVVTADEYERLTATGDTPECYSGGVYGPGVQVYTPVEYAKAKQDGELAKVPYVQMSWYESARSATNDWPGKVIPWLKHLAEGRPLRLLLGFDS